MIRGAWNADRATRRLRPEVDGARISVLTAAPCERSGSRSVWLANAEGGDRLAAAAEPLAVLRTLGDGWVVCIHDADADRLILAVDPLGSRSLHYAADGAGLVFGEDVVDVLALLERTPDPDGPAFSAWLGYGIVPARQSLYAGVRRLEPGTALVVERGTHRIHAYWSPSYDEPFDDPRADLAERLRLEVDAAIARAAAGVTRAGILLSGGFDSSTVAASLTDGGLRPHAFSAVFPEDAAADEQELIELAARRMGLDRTLHTVTGGAPLEMDQAFLERWRVPSTSPSAWISVPQFRQAKALGIEAMFDGEGGDELFGADPYPVITDRFAAGRLVEAWRMTRRVPGRATASRRTRLGVLSAFLRRDLPPKVVRELAARTGRGSAASLQVLLPAQATQAVSAFDQWAFLATDGPRWWRWRKRSLTGVRHVLDATGTLRRIAALGGMETRHPLMVDSRLTEFALRLPPESLFDPRFSRALARDAQVGRVPDEIRLSRRKSAFSSVLADTFLRDAAARLPDLLHPSSPLLGYCDPTEVAAWRSAVPRGDIRPDAGGIGQLWRLCVGEMWLRQLAGDQPST